MKGQLHLSWLLADGNSQKSLEALPAGIYVLQLSGSGLNAEHKRIIKL
jgi:hypothetical protein